MCSYKKKYKIILCDIIATGVVYLQFIIVLMYCVRCKESWYQFINSNRFFSHIKTNDSITDLYIQYQLNKLITITDNVFLSLIYNVYI